jgi:hypothetical protein
VRNNKGRRGKNEEAVAKELNMSSPLVCPEEHGHSLLGSVFNKNSYLTPLLITVYIINCF